VIRELLRGQRPALLREHWEIDWLYHDDAIEG
jgi:hypothetical protein